MKPDTLDTRFNSRRAVITGGASGLGLATAQILAQRGWRLGLLDRDAAGLESAAAGLLAAGGPRCEIYALDVADHAAVTAAIDDFAAGCGGLDLALNSAGVVVAGGFLETPPADWDWILGINVAGVANSCRAQLPHMLQGGGGLIINVASAAGFVSGSDASPYNATKAAVISLSESLQQEFAGRGVQVAAAMPGFFRTSLMEHARAPARARGFVSKMMEHSGLEAAAVAEEILARAATGETYIVLPARYRWLWRYKRLAPRRFSRWMRSFRD